MVKKQTRQCEHQAKRQEAREYLRDKKGPSKFCGNMQSSQVPKELVLGLPVGILWINQGPLETTKELTTRIQEEVPSAEIQRTEGEVALLILAVPEARANEGAALMKKAQRLWRWRAALRTPQRFRLSFEGFASREGKAILRNLYCAKWHMTWWRFCGRGRKATSML